jgi:hypothetical protein
MSHLLIIEAHLFTDFGSTSDVGWFASLASKVHPFLKRRRRTNDRAIKVAVIDTGIDATHERITAHLNKNSSKIIELRDWSASPHGVDDRVGHGTAVCDVLLRTAKVHLYVGKVSDEAVFDEKVPARVAQVCPFVAHPIGDTCSTLTQSRPSCTL